MLGVISDGAKIMRRYMLTFHYYTYESTYVYSSKVNISGPAYRQ